LRSHRSGNWTRANPAQDDFDRIIGSDGISFRGRLLHFTRH